jgi:hypothetical protein
MKLSKNNKSFEPCPEFSGQAVVVDVTPLKKVETAYGPKETFKLVFETPLLREDGTPCCVWSRGFTPSLHEKAAFAQFLRKWLGRALTAAEEAEFDTESLLGKTAEITVVHEEGKTGETYANIALIRPDKTGKAMKPSGKFKRVKDREQTSGTPDAEYRRTEQADDAGDAGDSTDWRRTKVHIGKHKGLDLGDLDTTAVTALIERWLPEVKSKSKLLADDRRLIAALEAAQKALTADGEVDPDNIPY